jgi:glycine betaine catabolism B
LDFECRSGICGKCKKRLLSGSVVMEVEDALSPTDKANRMILLCQARATQSVVVEA